MTEVTLRPTTEKDLDFVRGLESHPNNRATIKQWSREEHLNAIHCQQREHWIIKSSTKDERLGYLIAYDLTGEDCGAYIKRIVIKEKSRRIGRAAINSFSEHAFSNLKADYVWLCVYPDNERGQRCYRGAGYSKITLSDAERVHHRQAAESAPADELIMMSISKEDWHLRMSNVFLDNLVN